MITARRDPPQAAFRLSPLLRRPHRHASSFPRGLKHHSSPMRRRSNAARARACAGAAARFIIRRAGVRIGVDRKVVKEGGQA